MLELNLVPVAETPLVRAVADKLPVGRTGSAADCMRAWDGCRHRHARWWTCWTACWWRAGARAYWEGRSDARGILLGDIDR